MRFGAVRLSLSLSLTVLALSACPNCDDLGDNAAQVVLEPSVLDLGPVSESATCNATIMVSNVGGRTLEVSEANLEDVGGEFEIDTVVSQVGINSEEPFVIKYTSTGPLGERQSATLALATNDPDNEGVVRATITAIPVESTAGIAKAYCEDSAEDGSDGEEASDECNLLDFGAVNIGDATVPVTERSGLTMEIEVINTGSAAIDLQAALMNDGNPNFIVSGVRQGNVLAELPLTLLPSITEECGSSEPGDESKAYIDVFYAPASLGSDTDTVLILTNALEGSSLEIPVSGYGSDTGILINPPTIAFGGTAEGETDEISVTVSNVGINEASVNSTCIDIDGDETCDADCTGGDPILEGALGCEVFLSDGETHEGKGFILDPTDAQAGGSDERMVKVTWSPAAGNSTIPDGAVLRLETNILNNRAYTARLLGGSTGSLTVDAGDFLCASSVCVPTTGDAEDVSTWTGSASIELSNTGDASLTVSSFEWEGPATVADDFSLTDDSDADIDLEAPGITLAPGASTTIQINYANNDASGADYINLLINHTGLDLLKTVAIQVNTPQ